MKIALVSPYDYPYPGGVQEHIGHLEQNFTRLGHTVKIIAPSSSDAADLAKESIYKVGNVVSIPANGSVARITLSLRLSGRVKEILNRENFDIVHLHEPLTPALPLTVLRHSHSVNIGTFHRFGGTNFYRFYTKPILKRFFHRLDGRIAVSPTALKFVAQHFSAKYVIIPNGIDPQRFEKAPPFPELRDGCANILFVGRLEKRKGFKYLLQAFPVVKREFPKTRLLVVGGYSDKQKRRYQSVVQRHGLADVLFLGYASPADLPRYYQSCDIFCAPSIGGESFGVVLLEAMASGKPIVASAIEGYCGVMGHEAEGLLVEPKSPEALAEGLMHLLADPALGREMGERGRRKAQDYAWPKIARRLLAYYHAVMHTCGVGPPQEPPWEEAPESALSSAAAPFREA